MLPGIWILPGFVYRAQAACLLLEVQRSSGLLPEWGGRFQESYSPLYELPTRFPAFSPFRQFPLVSPYAGSVYSELFWSSRVSRDHYFLTGIPSLEAVKFLHSAQSVFFCFPSSRKLLLSLFCYLLSCFILHSAFMPFLSS